MENLWIFESWILKVLSVPPFLHFFSQVFELKSMFLVVIKPQVLLKPSLFCLLPSSRLLSFVVFSLGDRCTATPACSGAIAKRWFSLASTASQPWCARTTVTTLKVDRFVQYPRVVMFSCLHVLMFACSYGHGSDSEVK